jgi:hypothetical protein
MNTLDLNAYGVEEMNGQEMLVTEGGCVFKAIGKAAKAVADAVVAAAKFVAKKAVLNSDGTGGIRIG